MISAALDTSRPTRSARSSRPPLRAGLARGTLRRRKLLRSYVWIWPTSTRRRALFLEHEEVVGARVVRPVVDLDQSRHRVARGQLVELTARRDGGGREVELV